MHATVPPILDLQAPIPAAHSPPSGERGFSHQMYLLLGSQGIEFSENLLQPEAGFDQPITSSLNRQPAELLPAVSPHRQSSPPSAQDAAPNPANGQSLPLPGHYLPPVPGTQGQLLESALLGEQQAAKEMLIKEYAGGEKLFFSVLDNRDTRQSDVRQIGAGVPQRAATATTTVSDPLTTFTTSANQHRETLNTTLSGKELAPATTGPVEALRTANPVASEWGARSSSSETLRSPSLVEFKSKRYGDEQWVLAEKPSKPPASQSPGTYSDKPGIFYSLQQSTNAKLPSDISRLAVRIAKRGNDLESAQNNAQGASEVSAKPVPLELPGTQPLAQRGATAHAMMSLELPMAPDSKQWTGAFAEKVKSVLKANVRHAEIRLDPPHLGRIEVRIDLASERTLVSFASEHGVVRDAIDNSALRLREQLAEAGFTNIDVEISQHGDRKKQNLWNANINEQIPDQDDQPGESYSAELPTSPVEARDNDAAGSISLYV